jgi:hypothetical protein
MHDRDIRQCLRRELALKCPRGTVIVDEVGICQGTVRIDVVAVNESFYGYELKSATDSLKRLDNQVEVYNKVLDYASVVVSQNHLAGSTERVCPWWGIYLVVERNGALDVETVREPHLNESLEVRALAELLWHEETLKLLEERNALRGVKSKPRRFAWDRLVEVYSLDEIREAVRKKVRRRRKTVIRVK